MASSARIAAPSISAIRVSVVRRLSLGLVRFLSMTLAAGLALVAVALAQTAGAGAGTAEPVRAATPGCGPAGVLVIDAITADRAATQAALDALAVATGTQPLFDSGSGRPLENPLPADHFFASYKFACGSAAVEATRSPAWERLMGTLRPTPAQRLTVFMADPDHVQPSQATGECRRPAYFLLKGRVSDAPGYFAYLRALVASGLLQAHDVRREVVMPQREVRLSTVGPSFDPGEFFEILRFPCAASAQAFWDSPQYREIVTLREGKMVANAVLFE
jgi:Domain of unknown function (DUF1330)